MRVLLWDLPVWMRDMIERAIDAELRLEAVSAPAEVKSLREAVARARPDVVVTGPRDPKLPFGGFLSVLHDRPTLRMVSIGAGGQDTVQVTLIPTQESLGDISLDALLGVIAGDLVTVTVPPTLDALHE